MHSTRQYKICLQDAVKANAIGLDLYRILKIFSPNNKKNKNEKATQWLIGM